MTKVAIVGTTIAALLATIPFIVRGVVADIALLFVVGVACCALFLYFNRADSQRSFDEKRYRVLESIPDGFFILDDEWRFSHINERAEQFLRRSAAELIGTRIDSLLDPLASELVPEMQAVRRHGIPLERTQHFSATNRWIEIRMQPAEDEILVYLRDVTERKRAEMLLTESERRFRLLLHQVPAVLWTVDLDLRFTSILGGDLATYGLHENELVGRTFEHLLKDEPEHDTHLHAIQRVTRGESVSYEFRSGERWLKTDAEPLRDADGQLIGAIGVALDITEMKESAEHLSRLARQDAMTRLPNRLALEEELSVLLENAQRLRQALGVVFLDLDRFKTINDTLGHRCGDELLRAVSTRLTEFLGARARIFRPGGDEFVIVVHHANSRADVVKVVNDALTAFSRPFEIDGRELFVTASLGASLFPDNATTVTDLIKQADSAMYLAKEAGRCTARFYDGTIHARVLERLTLEQDLRQALAREEFHVELQPIVDLPTRRINAAEVLLRWTHPLLGAVPPDRFIAIAEELGIIVEISRWVIRNACRIASTIRANGYPDFRLSVNLSARDLYESDLLAFVGETLVENGLSSDALDVEVTEHVLLNDTAVRNLANLRALGIRVLIDDFGIGYSSLEYLKRLPVGAIKIDRSFISDVTRNTYDQAIVKAITTLGQALHVPVIAEGLESESQIEFVESLGCDQAQGYAFSRPVRLEAFMDLLPGRAMQKNRVIPLVRSNAS